MNAFLRISVAAFLAAGLFGFAGGCARAADKNASDHPANTESVAAVKTDSVAAPMQILFFMNPNGYPCQMQNGILENLKDSLTNRATITYIRTTDRDARNKFESYGIRGLPSLIIVDKTGKELKRFTPGVQSGDDIMAALRNSGK